VVPFLKVVNDTAVAVNQGGKRKGAVCTYLETWHLDIEEFLELRKNTGDDRRRTHDMNTANWIPDLFMRRVMEKGTWTLFSPSDVPDLHDKFGAAFEKAYVAYEAKAERGEIKPSARRAGHRPVAQDADHAVRDRPPLDHVQGRLQRALARSSTSAWCTRPTCAPRSRSTPATPKPRCATWARSTCCSTEGRPDRPRQAQEDHHTAMRMLDNVIDINYYAVKKARDSNLRHRPVGLGVMGFQDSLYELRIPYASQEAVEFADRSMEAICYYAYWASTELAASAANTPATRARCGTGHPAARHAGPAGASPRRLCGSGPLVHAGLGRPAQEDRQDGMRNSNCVAIAPTATISNIIGVDASIEPSLRQPVGQVQPVGRVHRHQRLPGARPQAPGPVGRRDGHGPQALRRLAAPHRPRARRIKALYATAFRSRPKWLVEAARAARSGSTRRSR
jgi:ribonucleoside-diphosphate reductase alpha chain